MLLVLHSLRSFFMLFVSIDGIIRKKIWRQRELTSNLRLDKMKYTVENDIRAQDLV